VVQLIEAPKGGQRGESTLRASNFSPKKGYV